MVLEISSLIELREYRNDPTKIIVIDFYADWCGPCKMIAPLYAQLATSFDAGRYGSAAENNGCSVVFLKCNVDRARDVAQFYKITSMPTFIVLHEEKIVDRFSGADIGRIEKVAKDNLLYIASKNKGKTTGTNNGATAPSSANVETEMSANPNQLINAAARHLTTIASNPSAAEKPSLDLLAFLKNHSHTRVAAAAAAAGPTATNAGAAAAAPTIPLGVPLIPFLACDAYPTVPNEPLNVFLSTLVALGAAAKGKATKKAATEPKMVCEGGVCKIDYGGDADNETDNASSSSASAASATATSTVTAVAAAKPVLGNILTFVAPITASFTPAEDAVAIVTNIARTALNALTFETWHVVGANGVTPQTTPNPNEQQMAALFSRQNGGASSGAGKAPPLPPYNGRWHTVLLRLLRSETALKILFAPSTVIGGASGQQQQQQKHQLLVALTNHASALLTPSPLVMARWMKTGKQLELNSLLGALLSPGYFPSRANLHGQQIQMIAMLNPTGLVQQQTDPRLVRAEIERNLSSVATQIHNEMDAHVERCFPIFRELLGKKGAVRSGVLRWLQQFFAANAGFTRQNREKSELCADSVMLCLSHILVELALPITSAVNGFEKTIPTEYYSDLNALCVKLPMADSPSTSPSTSDAGAGAGADGASLLPSRPSSLAAVEKEVRTTLEVALNARSVVHFGLSRSDVERVCHFKPLKDETLNDYAAVAEVMKAATAAAAVDKQSPAAAASSPAVDADEDDNAAATSAVAAAAVTSGDDDSSLFPLPAINPLGSSSPTSATSPVVGEEGGGEKDALFANNGVNYYPPRVHIFFMALRAISLSQSVLLSTLQQLEQQMNHPRTSARDKCFLMALHGTHKAMLANTKRAKKTVQFLNGVARWLLFILGADRETGALPTVVPSAWKLMPQQIIDQVLTALTLVTKHSIHGIQPSDLDDIISLFLVLMGNLTFFPKAHTHALFPTIILELLNSPLFAPALTRHRWFQSNIVLGCVRTYIAMEKCYYDKTSCRYYLSVCLKRFLAEDLLCYPARPALQDKQSRLLERFTHMVTTEANQAIDEVLTALALMRLLESEGKDVVADDGSDRSAGFNANATGRRRGANNNNNRNRNNSRGEGGGSIYTDDDDDEDEDDNAPEDADDGTGAATGGTNTNVATETYPQLGERLKNGLLLFGEAIAVFKLLSRQFQAGVLQHMVAQQIANMLVQNIAKLAGKSSGGLKVKNPEMWGFNPRQMLDSLVDCFVHFRDERVFIDCVLESIHAVTTPEEFTFAVNNITNPNRTLVIGSLAEQLREMQAALEAANVGRDLEEQIWDDEAPEFAFCALMSTPLKDPVVLPMPSGGGDSSDFIFVERDVIRHRLLELEENPFSRQKLTEGQLNAYNEEPNVKAAVVELKKKIAAYAAERRAQLMAEKKCRKESDKH